MCLCSTSWLPHNFLRQTNKQFVQKTDHFWEFQEETNSWVQVQLPYDLFSCVNNNCTKVGLIDRKTITGERKYDSHKSLKKKDGDGGGPEENSDIVLSQRKRISLTKMSETSIWVTGESGSIYERFWNGVQWVIAPHDLPISAGRAISIFIVNQTILALSEVGSLYQMQLSESSQPVWVDFTPILSQSMHQEADQSPAIQIKSGVVSHDGV